MVIVSACAAKASTLAEHMPRKSALSLISFLP
jgi:hypothetical protein